MQKKTYHTVEGIVIKRVPYKDRSVILTLFTKQEGILPCISYTTSEKNVSMRQLTSPLCHGEYILKKGKGMDTIVDGSIYSLQASLRTSYAHISAAAAIATTLFETQMEQKPSTALFELTTYFFKKLPLCDPECVTACFLAKLLVHEGAFSKAHPRCTLTSDEWLYASHLASLKSLEALQSPLQLRSTLEKLKAWALALHS